MNFSSLRTGITTETKGTVVMRVLNRGIGLRVYDWTVHRLHSSMPGEPTNRKAVDLDHSLCQYRFLQLQNGTASVDSLPGQQHFPQRIRQWLRVARGAHDTTFNAIQPL